MPIQYLKLLKHSDRKSCGFTLVELMVVMTIVGILAIGVVFMFADPTAKVKAAAFEMRGDFNLARAEAVKENESILVDFIFTAESDCNKTSVANFAKCYSGAGNNQGYVICFDEDANSDCSNEAATTAELKDKIIKTVIFKDPVKFYAEIGGALPSSPLGSSPSVAPVGGTLNGNNGLVFKEPTDPTVDYDFYYMNSNGTSSHYGSVVIYLPKDGDATTLTIKGKPYAVVVESANTGNVTLKRWRPESGVWSRK